jgi:aspartate aminotransferase
MTSFSDSVSRISVSSTLAVLNEAERYRAQGVDLVDFGPGEPDFATPGHIKQAAVQAIQENFTRYTAAGGTAELRQAIVEWHAREFATPFTQPECLVTVGGKHAIFNAVCALVNPGDEVVIPAPYWVSFKDIVLYAGGSCVFVPTSEADGYELSAEAVEQAMTPRTRLVILNSPNNPSGAVIRQQDMERIARSAAARNVWTLSDECYSHFVYDSPPYSVGVLAKDEAIRSRLVVVGSMSKTFAMTGWRCGYALAPKALIGEMLKLQSHTTSNPASISQKAALAALRGPMDSVCAMLAEYRRRRDFIVEGLRRIPGVTCPMPRGAFYAYPNVGRFLGPAAGSTAELAARLLREARTVVVPGEAFGTTDHLRLSYATSLEELGRGLERLRTFFAGIQPKGGSCPDAGVPAAR